MKNPNFYWCIGVTLLACATGCGTRKYVQQENGAVHTRVDDLERQVEQAQTDIRRTGERVGENERQIGEVSKTAQEALQRAQEAGKLADGKLLDEAVLTDEKVRFAVDKAELSDEAKAALDQFAQQLNGQYNHDIYIEIQGHTDAIGSEEFNLKLGLERAEAVRRYLNREHNIPLHRMSAISYGEAEPIAENSTRKGRAKNRRIVLVALNGGTGGGGDPCYEPECKCSDGSCSTDCCRG